MPAFKNITGLRFGRLVVLEPRSRDRNGVRWLCRCDCGQQPIIRGVDLTSGNTKSCGCLNRETRASRSTTHGQTYTAIWRSWVAMHQRCLNPRTKDYKNYGGRGVTICDRWLHNFVTFRADILAAIGDRPPGMTLDRIDNDGDYEPGNVRWATPKQQRANQQLRSVQSTLLAGEVQTLNR